MDSHEIMQRIANSRIVFRDSFRDLEHFYNTINKDEIRFTIVSSDQLIKKILLWWFKICDELSIFYALKSLVQAQINNLNITEEFKKEYDAIQPEMDVIRAIVDARTSQNMTQKELAERTGINQADISKLENGPRNPSVNLLKRLADGMGMALKIEFVPKRNI